ncbi:MAG: hypothetical protein ABMA64_12970 [Myxococcota bacterium]
MRLLLLSIVAVLPAGCAYHIGQGVTAGAMEELQGKGKSGGVSHTADMLLQREVLSELGHQLGQGLTAGATEIDPDQQAKLEQTIDDLITVAARRTGKGLRTEVSPELREMVRRDIVGALTEGLNGPLGDSLERTVDRVVARAVGSLRTSLADDDLRMALSDLLRDSVYFAMKEDQLSPAVGETIESTLTEHMLIPIESSVGGLTNGVAWQVAEASRRTENTLRGVIGALIVVSSVVAMLYFVRNRQVRRLEEQNVEAQRGLRDLDAALQMVDPSVRDAVRAKLEEYQTAVADTPTVAHVVHPRGDDYQRRH